MSTWKLEIEYEGTRYRGWQIQHNAKTVQGELMAAARELFASRVEIGGSGRTDAGVHALEQIAHLKATDLKENVTPRQIQHGFNDLLPHDIHIKKVTNAPDNFDARRDAVSRYYIYQIATRRTAFGKNFVWWIKDHLDPRAMETAAKLKAAGIPVALQSGYEGYVPKTRVVLFEAGMAAQNGLSQRDALALITIDAAKILGLDNRIGSLAVGKDADLALFDGDPLEWTTHCVGTIINGVLVNKVTR